jgi:hypothetical protein
MLPAQQGGLTSPQESGTRGLLVVFDSYDTDTGFGAAVDTENAVALDADTGTVGARLTMWSCAATAIRPGWSFTIRYLNEVVGYGVVSAVEIDQVGRSAADRWFEAYGSVYEDPARWSELSCPSCGATSLRIQFVAYDDESLLVTPAFWCDECHCGLVPCRSVVPDWATVVTPDQAQVPDYTIVLDLPDEQARSAWLTGFGTWDDVYLGLRWLGPEGNHPTLTDQQAQINYRQHLLALGGRLTQLADLSLHDAVPCDHRKEANTLSLVLGIGDNRRGYELATLAYHDAQLDDPAQLTQPHEQSRWQWVTNEVDQEGEGYIHRIIAQHPSGQWASATIRFSGLDIATQACSQAQANR